MGFNPRCAVFIDGVAEATSDEGAYRLARGDATPWLLVAHRGLKPTATFGLWLRDLQNFLEAFYTSSFTK